MSDSVVQSDAPFAWAYRYEWLGELKDWELTLNRYVPEAIRNEHGIEVEIKPLSAAPPRSDVSGVIEAAEWHDRMAHTLRENARRVREEWSETAYRDDEAEEALSDACCAASKADWHDDCSFSLRARAADTDPSRYGISAGLIEAAEFAENIARVSARKCKAQSLNHFALCLRARAADRSGKV